MNKQECDILNTILSEPYVSQRMLSEGSGHCVGVVNRSIKNLKKEGYLDEQIRLTEKAQHEFREKAPRNAVILADGFGMRTGPDDVETPKGLLKVRGETLIERTIRQLHEAGIREIYVVIGFRKEQYEYLIDAYGVGLIVNPDYASNDTLCSLSRALPHLSNTYIIPCDVWCGSNPYRRHELYSWYMVGDVADSKSAVRVNRKMELVSVPGQTDGNAVVGIAYLLEEQTAVVKRRIKGLCKGGRYGSYGGQESLKRHRGYEDSGELEGHVEKEGSEGLERHGRHGGSEGHGGYERDTEKSWESVLYEKDRMIIPARVVHGKDTVRIRTSEQLRGLDSPSGQLKADVLAVCSRFLGGRPDEIVDVTKIKKGMTDRTFLFSGRGRKYIIQIPEEDADRQVDPGREAQIYTSIAGKGICDEPACISMENGCRITYFLDGTRSCDPMDADDLEKCMSFLKRFHGMGIIVDHEVDMFGLIMFYEDLWGGKQSLYKDYVETKENVLSLKPYLDSQVTQKSLTHMDAVPDKFLFIDRGNREELQLVGWEHAGMQDPHVDIAMFCIASLYDKERVDRLIGIYFGGKCPDSTRIKIYCYIAVCGLLRSNWCEYKIKQGEEFGEYSLRQYRYAKEYYRFAREGLVSIGR